MCSNDQLYPCLFLFIHRTGKVFHIALSPLILERISHVASTGLDGHSFSCEPGLDASYTTVKMVLTQHPEITAIVTGNILVSSAITRATYDSGLRIPEDVSIVALVTSRFAEMTAPTLTTIDFPSRKMGHMGAEMLIRQLEGEQVSSQVLLRPPLTIRQSSGLCMR